MIPVKTIHVVSGALVSPDREGLLMGLRGPMALRPLLWELPGGKVEPTDVGPRMALAREWREEIEVDVVAGERIATGVIHADVCVLIELFEVRLVDARSISSRPGSRDHLETRWVDPRVAVAHLPCSPGLYELYPFLRLWWDRRFLHDAETEGRPR